ncbi:MAG: nicotinate (nicotinamide) nucleotide adenylyltransferase [Lentisphaerae bacterium]|jgi:nicotinate-nucleotide adenylyltransferase|nr:nicotinate (nicotinamide) nucleotide adenylyltransferase [Lentisphaerota bacterium]MBT4817982.1 nicotinate (nicotinamide) nucleotide adenylyltransferase [Lentisphaerota bacterium]MBT5605581.1 nicotinate (nicotinamide) nucleotide adenylyltransferase [Lentisphaerota bacterium]MBT7054853.1 nicotinate (nicotinamide) nucleotide adenylyltransferase [Lentisphaerota bacterium]MBT7841600.1 nicotinate (nicotinamide) nucleotide adenylyltransferase [Lentisphaerota bacterium]
MNTEQTYDTHTPEEPLPPNQGMPHAECPKLAVFGGAFDPIHLGHLSLAEAIVDAGCADEVLFVPTGAPPHKTDIELTSPEHRLAMLGEALAPHPHYSLSDIEIRRTEGYSYTIDTLAVLSRVFPEHEIFFLMGMDCLAALHTWHRATELVQRYEFIIYPRPGVIPPSFAELANLFGRRNARRLLDAVVQLDVSPISATQVRESCAAGRDIETLVPGKICGYIEKHGLYAVEERATV